MTTSESAALRGEGRAESEFSRERGGERMRCDLRWVKTEKEQVPAPVARLARQNVNE